MKKIMKKIRKKNPVVRLVELQEEKIQEENHEEGPIIIYLAIFIMFSMVFNPFLRL
jgi:hypothetical protein